MIPCTPERVGADHAHLARAAPTEPFAASEGPERDPAPPWCVPLAKNQAADLVPDDVWIRSSKSRKVPATIVFICRLTPCRREAARERFRLELDAPRETLAIASCRQARRRASGVGALSVHRISGLLDSFLGVREDLVLARKEIQVRRKCLRNGGVGTASAAALRGFVCPASGGNSRHRTSGSTPWWRMTRQEPPGSPRRWPRRDRKTRSSDVPPGSPGGTPA